LLLFVAALVSAGLIACGGGSGNNEDPQKVLDETFQSGKDYSKGALDMSLKLSAEGSQSGSLDATLKGPFQSQPGGLPQFDIAADVNVEGSGQSFGFQGGLTSTGDAAFVNFRGSDYQVDAPTLNNFKQLFLAVQKQSAGQKQAGGLNPSGFLTDLKNEGTEDIDGAKTIHISGKVDANKFVDQVQGASAGAGAPGAAQLDQLRQALKAADIDVFTGADDKRLRRIDANLVFEPAASATGGSTSKITAQFSLTFSHLGEPQTITAPANPKPLAELLSSVQGLQGALGAAGGSGAGSGGGATPTAPSGGQSSQYLDCLSKAKGQAAVQACASALQ
jgi:hypothetical protein